MAEEKVLNKEQKQAVEYSGGPLLIIAGAGTGKTTVITERIKYLIVQKKVSPTNILALTFTEKAAKEMQDRVDVALPLGYANMWISTFHSFGDRILKNEIVNLGLTSRYSLLSEAEAVAFMKKHLAEFGLDYFRPLGNPNKYLSDILKHFSRLKDENISPLEYIEWIKKQKTKNKKQLDHTKETDELEDFDKCEELTKAYTKYEELKTKQGLLDYGDLIFLVIKLFRTRSSVLAKYKKQFTHLLVDEFQDTNYAQYELVKLLAPPGGETNLTIVADDNQSIYKFRGASVSNILDFNRDYPKAESIVLNKNYRSSQTILDHAYQLIKFNDPDTLEVKLGISKKLEKQRDVAEIDPEFHFFNRVEDEAEFIANEIGKATNNQQTTYNYKDFAILVRANNHAEPFVRALTYKGIPYQFLGPGLLFRQPEIKELLAYLKLLVDHSDSIAAFRILSLKHFDLSGRSLIELNRYANHEHLTLIEVCEEVTKLAISDKDQQTIATFIEMYHRHLDLAKTESAGQVLYRYLEDMDAVTELVKEENSTKSQNLNKFFDKIKAFESNREDKSIYALADYFDLITELGESPLASADDWVGNDAVNIITVHSAKGLEFSVVFMVNLVNARFPSTERSDKVPLPDGLIKEHLPEGDFHLQEERRLFYVGMTRAKDRLYLLGSKFYNEEAKREKKPSPFVIEALGDKVISSQLSVISNKQLSFLDFAPNDKQNLVVSQYPNIPVSSLSSSQIADFKLCPLKYYYKYILKIPLPQPPAGIFGSVIHDTLCDFYDKAINGDKVSEKIMQDLYESNWQTGGYESKHQRESYYKQGVNYLTDYYIHTFDPKQLPALMEQTFNVKVAEKLKLTGRIDRIDLTNNGIEIIDYKTGKPKDEKNLKKDFQLDLYALAVSLGGLRQPGILDKVFLPQEIIVSYYYFDNQQKVSFVKTKEDLEIARQLVIDTAKEIGSTDFRATPGMHCDYCEFKLLCNAWK